jgi:hypothetical protein
MYMVEQRMLHRDSRPRNYDYNTYDEIDGPIQFQAIIKKRDQLIQHKMTLRRQKYHRYTRMF